MSNDHLPAEKECKECGLPLTDPVDCAYGKHFNQKDCISLLLVKLIRIEGDKPSDYHSWKDAALDERLKRVAVSNELSAAKLIVRELMESLEFNHGPFDPGEWSAADKAYALLGLKQDQSIANLPPINEDRKGSPA